MDIQITHLIKQYGSYRALDDISLAIGEGMFGLLGPNGAGKTTLLRILTTQLAPTAGEVLVGGLAVEREPGTIRQRLGYLPQDFGFYRSLSAFEMLDYIAAMKNIPRPQRAREIERVLHEVNLTSEAKRKVGGYSGGMKQRLGIAQALLGDPQLLVVDEPTVGLDPEERIRFRNVLARIAGQRTVVLSTHIVADIEASCSAVAVLRRGKLLFAGPPAALVREATGRVWQITVTPDEWEQLTAQVQVIASRPLGAHLLARVVADANPLGRGEPADGGLEEGYMAVMAREVAHA